ncbi:SIR2 family protein [Aneurinibacillus sp. Ricciae_BoGa-3]|uniref:SIR2 family protein n=1 Tax=Aneurinibacillus sp. Ricciae_BoGa-3 TaxID=3022697 RepID=UPI00234184DB|nr:SIR2 family protein [Aneurinibacillus sp. Ricciae_BoGa-3]WCK53820.1 SIR2 family protein [Aneurinibacillus sp. Ricciae_BoGa-3]
MKKRIPAVFFTGAGATRADPISLPTMKEFFQRIMDENRVPKSPRIRDREYFKFIFDTLYGEDTNYDLERVMGALYELAGFTDNDCWKIFHNPEILENIMNKIKQSQYSGLMHTSGVQHPIENARNLIKVAIDETHDKYKEAAKRLIFDLEWIIRETYEEIPNEHIRAVYEPLVEILIKNAIECDEEMAPLIPFFTTNYDMSIDWFFQPYHDKDITTQEEWERQYNKNIKFIDGFAKRGWDTREYTSLDENSTDSIFIPYFKLHGSLYWEKVAGRIKVGTNTANDPHNPRDLMIVYPSDKKILYDEPYHFNHRSLDSYLKRTDNLFIVGFSFRDPGLVRSFETALLDNENLNIFVICPEFNEDYFPEMAKFFNQPRVIPLYGYFGTAETNDQIASQLSLRLMDKRLKIMNSPLV